METNVKTAIEFDIYKVLYMVKTNKDLLAVFNSVIDVSIQTTITNAKNDLLNEKTVGYLKSIYNIIVSNETYYEEYSILKHNYTSEETINQFKIPRRYGKNKILSDIKNDNRKPTQIEKTLFAINNIKNIYVKLDKKLIHDLFVERTDLSGDKFLTEEQCRDIIALQELMTTKLKDILK
jgi:hypothetical protein